VIGAAVAGPHDAAGGAAVGALAGAAVGAAAESGNARRTPRVDPRLERRASDYRRAISACLEGRSYAVK